MPNPRATCLLVLSALLLANGARGQDGAKPMSMMDDVRDRRYCEFFVVKREGVHLKAAVFNTLGLNNCSQAQWETIDTAKIQADFGALDVIRNGPRHFVMDRLATGDLTGSVVDMQGLAMRQVATLDVPLSALVEKRASYTVQGINRTTEYVFLAGRPVFELIDPDERIYVMQAYSQEIDPTLSYAALATLGERLKPPTGWRYRSRVLDADLVADVSGEAHIIQDELRNTYQRVPVRP
jgi:haloalkane dehalogenase